MPQRAQLALNQHQHRGSVIDRRRALRTSRVDIGVALGLAGLVNVSMLVVAAGALHDAPVPAESLHDMHSGLGSMLGPGAALAFALALLVLLTRRADVMGSFVNRRATTACGTVVAVVVAVVVAGLNVFLLARTLLG